MDATPTTTTRGTSRRIEMHKAARCGSKGSHLSLRGCVYAAAVVTLWSTAHGVDAQQAFALAASADDAVTAEPVTHDTLVDAALATEPPALGEEEVDDMDLPEPTDAPTPPTITTVVAPTAAPAATTAPTPPQKPMDSLAPTHTTESPSPTTTTVEPANTNNALSNNATNLRGTANGVHPGLLIGLAVLCTAFLAVWIRRRRDSIGADGGADGGGGGASGGSSVMSGMATTSSKEKRAAAADSGGKKAQYSRLDNRTEEEEEDLEDEFGGRSGSWDDWDNQQRIDIRPEADEEGEDHRRGTAALTRGMGSSSSSSSMVTPQPPPPRSAGSVRTSTAGVKIASPPPSTGRAGGGGGHLQETAVSPPPRPTSVASNSSSNESFEVVVSPPPSTVAALPALPVDLLSDSLSQTTAPIVDTSATTTSVEDDLFSQFGMVPTFKKGVQQLPAVISAPPLAHSAYAAPHTAALNPFAASPPLSAAADASTLFAADLDDMELAGDAAAGANEWGDEEDDWVQGL